MKDFDSGLYGLSMFFSIQLQRLHSERTVERYISKFLVTGDVKAETIGRSYEETRNVFLLKKARVSFVFESRTLRQTFIVGVLIFTQGERKL